MGKLAYHLDLVESLAAAPMIDAEPVDMVLLNGLWRSNADEWVRKTGRYHPSAIGASNCLRQLAYDRVGVTPEPLDDPSMNMYALLGSGTHDVIQGRLTTLLSEFTCEGTIDIPGLKIYGHYDGKFMDEFGEWWVLEIKTVGHKKFAKLSRPIPWHMKQGHCYMYGLGIPRIQLLYVCRDDGRMRTFKRGFSMKTWAEVMAKLEAVENTLDRGELPPRKRGSHCSSCPFNRYCSPGPEYSTHEGRYP